MLAQLAVAQAEGAPLLLTQLALEQGEEDCEALIEGEREGVTVEHPEAEREGELLALWLARLAVAQAEDAPLLLAQLALEQIVAVCEALAEGEREGDAVEQQEADGDGEPLALRLARLADTDGEGVPLTVDDCEPLPKEEEDRD